MTICDYWPVCLNRGLLNPDSAEGKLCVDRSWKRCAGGCKHRKVGGFLSPFIERGMKHRVEILNNLIGKEHTKIIATSKAVADILGSFGLNRAMIDVIIPGVDTTLFRPGPKNRERIALFVGRPDPLKGSHIFGRIAKKVKSKIPDARFVAIGGSLPNSHVESLGKVDFNTLLSFYQSASCLCVPSIWPEPLGSIALEAMSCCTPVVAHRLGGLVETIDDGNTGFLVEPGDINRFANKVSFLLLNQEERMKMGLLGRRRIEEKFDIKNTFKSYLTIYKKLAKS
jgi:glycosyltransferase involved in cell wall biosynthesis